MQEMSSDNKKNHILRKKGGKTKDVFFWMQIEKVVSKDNE